MIGFFDLAFPSAGDVWPDFSSRHRRAGGQDVLSYPVQALIPVVLNSFPHASMIGIAISCL
jgi:hypothetical protein